jgi:hypothetical protein
MKSISSYETYMNEKKQMEKVTSENLITIEKKLNEGYTRSV